MKLILTIVLFALLFGSVMFTKSCIRASYEYENNISAEWTLADRSSTIPAKRQHLDKFVTVLENSGLQGSNNAIIYPTAENSFDNNFAALKTLQSRLHEIETMDVRSFEYQTAIQQITAQEQGEANSMLAVFAGCWYLKHYPLLWEWIGMLLVCVLYGGVAITGLILLIVFIDI